MRGAAGVSAAQRRPAVDRLEPQSLPFHSAGSDPGKGNQTSCGRSYGHSDSVIVFVSWLASEWGGPSCTLVGVAVTARNESLSELSATQPSALLLQSPVQSLGADQSSVKVDLIPSGRGGPLGRAVGLMPKPSVDARRPSSLPMGAQGCAVCGLQRVRAGGVG